MTKVYVEVEKTISNLKGAKNWLISKIFDKFGVKHCVGTIERVSTSLNLRTYSFSKINNVDQKFATY
jgi:hypothetical protein